MSSVLWPDADRVQIDLRVNDSQATLDVTSIVVIQQGPADPWPPPP